MATITRQEIIQALGRLGQLAEERGTKIELLLLGGALMVLAYEERQSTRDVDAVILAPSETRIVRELACVVAREHDWPDDWLNDGAKGFLVGVSLGPLILSAPGIEVRGLATTQVLAMKLSAWRDDVDIGDARRLLRELSGSREEVWRTIEPYLSAGDELKAQYAFADLWEEINDKA